MNKRLAIFLCACLLCKYSWRASAGDFYVSPGGAGIPPFADWGSAATNIQDAIDAASAGDVVWVTNGTYTFGGKFMAQSTNRVALDKALTVQSANGAAVTAIVGAWDSATNGPLAVRCAALTNGAVLKGFTLIGGATQQAGSGSTGGGIWANSSLATVSDCLIVSNSAASSGAAAYRGTISNSTLAGNISFGTAGAADNCTLLTCVVSDNYAAMNGGGIYFSSAKNCAIVRNRGQSGSGAYSSKLVNCTLTGNWVISSGAGSYQSSLTNCIVYNNLWSDGVQMANYYSCTMIFCCSTPLPSGLGNTVSDPQLLADGIHIASTSPCLGSGTNNINSGLDIDGQPWANPPAIGCDEWHPIPIIARQPHPRLGLTPRLELNIGDVVVAGQEPFYLSWTKDGTSIDDDGHYGASHTTNLVVESFGPGDAVHIS